MRLCVSVLVVAGAAALVAVAPGCGNGTKLGSGVPKNERRKVEDFTGIRVEGAADVEVTVGKPTEVSVQTDDNLLDSVRTETSGHSLRIVVGAYTSGSKVKVRVSTPQLHEIEVGGATRFTATALQAEDFAVDVSGSSQVVLTDVKARDTDLRVAGDSRIEVASLDTKQCEVSLNGVGLVEVKGTCEELRVDVDGSGHADLTALRARTGRVDVSGSGKADVDVSDNLTVKVEGTGQVTYGGNPPKFTQDVAPGGKVTPRGK